jgi:hypothetical protein
VTGGALLGTIEVAGLLALAALGVLMARMTRLAKAKRTAAKTTPRKRLPPLA